MCMSTDTIVARGPQVLVRADDFRGLWAREKQAGLASEDFLWRLGLGRSECNALINGISSRVSAAGFSAVFDALFGALPAPPPYGDRHVGYTLGNHHLQKLWPPATRASWPAVISVLTRHEEGPKEGTKLRARRLSRIPPAQGGRRRDRGACSRLRRWPGLYKRSKQRCGAVAGPFASLLLTRI